MASDSSLNKTMDKPRHAREASEQENLPAGSPAQDKFSHDATPAEDHVSSHRERSTSPLRISKISPPSAPERGTLSLSNEEQEEMFHALKDIFEKVSEEDEAFDFQDLLAALDLADGTVSKEQQTMMILGEVRRKIDQLWASNSTYMARATELLANGSRDPKWRVPFGQSGILEIYLRIIATSGIDDEILLHSLRLIGNSCADTDENRQLVVQNNYTLPIIRLFSNSAVLHVAIPVIYNICADFEAAQAQVALNGVLYKFLELLTNDSIEGNALLTCAHEIMEMASERDQAVDDSPEDSLRLILDLLSEDDLEKSHFISLGNTLAAYLQRERFQYICVEHRHVETVFSIVQEAYEFEDTQPSADGDTSLVQLRLKIIQALSDVSALPPFSQYYPLSSSLVSTLISWLGETKKDQLQICACILLGNISREDEICESMIKDFKVLPALISILNGDAKGGVLHAVLGFLKNLTVAGDNREFLGEAGVIQAVSRIWAFDSVPQVQFMATSLTRQVVSSSTANIGRLLEPLSPDPDSPAHSRTYLSLLLSLFAKSDSTPIHTEIGRTVAAICRSLLRLDKGSSLSDESQLLVSRLFDLHEDVSRPLGAMITQTEWPVIQSEGWFALALMANCLPGSAAVVDCIENTSVMQLLSDTIRMSPSDLSNTEESEQDKLKRSKDRDNVIILMHGLLKNNPHVLTQTRRDILEDLMGEAGRDVSGQVQNTDA